MAALPTEQDGASPSPAVAKGPQVGGTYGLPELPQKEAKRRQLIADTWKAYKGDWGTGPLAVETGEPDDNVRPNLCMPIVDVGVNFLFGEVVKIELTNDTDSETGIEVDVDNGAEDGTSPAQAYLDDCWGDDDDKMALLTEVALNGAIAGSAFVMLVPANKAAGQDCPRIVVLDPGNVTVMADPHDCKTVNEYWVQYDVETYDLRTGQPQTTTYRKVICRNDPGDPLASESSEGYDPDDSWQIIDYARQGLNSLNNGYRSQGGREVGAGGGAWQCVAVTPWPKPYPPIVDCQNLPAPNDYWGLSDLPKDLVQMNRALIFNESNIMRTIKHYVAPMRYASGVTTNTMSTSPDNMLLFASPEARLNALDVKADLANAMAFSENLRSAMDEQSQIPGVALGRLKDMPRGAIPGVTIRALYKPPMAKTTKKRRLYGKLIREVSMRLLDLGNFSEAAKAKIMLHWGDPLPSDDLAAAQTAQIWQSIGVSGDTLMQQEGFDPDVEADKKQQEQMRQVTAFSQGQGLPPNVSMMPNMMGQMAPNQPPQTMKDTTQPGEATSQPSQRQTGPSEANPGNADALNHPKAQIARAMAKANAPAMRQAMAQGGQGSKPPQKRGR